MRLRIPVFVLLLLPFIVFTQHTVGLITDENPTALIGDYSSLLGEQSSTFSHHSSMLTPHCPPTPGDLPGFSRMKRTGAKNWVCIYTDELCLAEKYDIVPGLASAPRTTPRTLITIEQPVFNTASLHREEVVEDILKWIRKQEWDFSGVIEELYMQPVGTGSW